MSTARCTCCDLPAYSCGTAQLRTLTETDPEYAAYLTTAGAAPGTSAPDRPALFLSVPSTLRTRIDDFLSALAVYAA